MFPVGSPWNYSTWVYHAIGLVRASAPGLCGCSELMTCASGHAGGSTAIVAAAASATAELFRWGENSAMARAMEVRLPA